MTNKVFKRRFRLSREVFHSVVRKITVDVGAYGSNADWKGVLASFGCASPCMDTGD